MRSALRVLGFGFIVPERGFQSAFEHWLIDDRFRPIATVQHGGPSESGLPAAAGLAAPGRGPRCVFWLASIFELLSGRRCISHPTPRCSRRGHVRSVG